MALLKVPSISGDEAMTTLIGGNRNGSSSRRPETGEGWSVVCNAYIMRCVRQLRIRPKILICIGIVSLLLTLAIVMFGGDLHYVDRQSFSKLKKIQAVHKMAQALKFDSQPRTGQVNFHIDDRPPTNLKRVSEYCNIPHSQMASEEGMVPNGYKLLNVHTVIRHGDRSPIANIGLSSELSCLMNGEQFSHLPKVISYISVMSSPSTIRNREPFKSWAMYPNHKICGQGQLTGQGVVQHLLNGMLYSERYIHQHRLFDETNWDSNVVIASTEVSRTFQSAMAFAFGMLPEFNASKLNLEASNILFCDPGIPGSVCSCPGLDIFRVQAERECKLSSAHSKMFTDLKSHFSEVLSIPTKKLPGPITIWDALSTYACHSLPLPCNSNGTCITSKGLETLWLLEDTRMMCMGKNPKYKMYTKAYMQGLLAKIMHGFNAVIEDSSNPKFYLYSGHDTTVTPLITALEMSDNVWPGYATRITFELYRKEGTSNYVIRILRNGVVATGDTVVCKGNTDQEGFCSLSHFERFVSKEKVKAFCESIRASYEKK